MASKARPSTSALARALTNQAEKGFQNCFRPGLGPRQREPTLAAAQTKAD